MNLDIYASITFSKLSLKYFESSVDLEVIAVPSWIRSSRLNLQGDSTIYGADPECKENWKATIGSELSWVC